jgi:ParB family chromosome partitioning protein
MKMKHIQPIPEKEILPDFFFRFSLRKETAELERSVRCSGILNPIWVLRHSSQGGFRIVSGFSRFRAAVKAGLEEVPCRILEESVPAARHFEEALLEHASMRDLHLTEKARVLDILSRLEVPDQQILSRFAPLLDLPAKTEELGETLGILKLHPKLLLFLELYPVSLRQVQAFERFDAEAQAALADLGSSLQIRIVELIELASHVFEISRRDGRTIGEVLNIAGMAGILADEDLNRNGKIMKIKEILKRLRFPRLISWNEKIRNLRDETGMPGFLRMHWDPSLESAGFNLDAQIRTPGDLDALIRFLFEPDKRKKLSAVLDIV